MKRVLLKLLVASLAIVGAVLLVRSVLVPGIELVFQPSASIASVLRRTGIFVTVLLAYWAFAKHYEKRAAVELRLVPFGIALGALSGAVLISITTVSLFAFGLYEITGHRGLQGALLGVAGVIFVAAFLEEVAYRCVLFRILEEAWGTSAALWLQSLIFAAMHLANAESSVMESMTTMVAVTLIGAFWTSLYIRTRNLWVVTAHHAAWNFAIILTGLPLSGIDAWRALAPIESRSLGPVWLTGGVFGPEDSIITIAVVTLSLVVVLRSARKARRVVVASAISAT